MKKFLTIALVAIMLMAMAVPFASAEDAKIIFGFWDTNQEPGMKAIAEAFMAQNPGVSIEVQVTPWDQYWTKLEAAAMGGEMPDVFWMHSNQFFKYADAGILMDLTDLDVDYSPYPEGVTALYTFDGAHLAVPKDYDTIALAYNKEIFDAAGEPYPDDTWDWAKLLEVAKRLTDPDKGIWGFGAPNDQQSGYLSFIYQNEGFAFENGQCGYNLDATKEALKFWTDLQLVEGVSPTQAQFNEITNDERFQAGQLAMEMVGSWMMSAYTAADSPIAGKFDLAVLPQGKVRASIYNGLGYAGYANTKYPDAVKAFIKFCGSEEANKIAGENKAAIPAYAGTEHYFTDLFTEYNIACYTEMIEYGVQYPFSPNKSLWEGTETEIMNSVYAGEITAEEAADQIYATICDVEGI